MDKEMLYTINQDSFKRVEKKKEKESVIYERGLFSDAIRSLRENKLAMFCAVLLGLIVILSILAPLSPYDPDAQNVTQKLLKPSAEHWFGTDELGRD